jgi:hypothetical protein
VAEPAIALSWIKEYIDALIAGAARFPEGSKMHDAILIRADHAMDMVKSWKETHG